jgi:uncharacterized protein (TIGR02265 family)
VAQLSGSRAWDLVAPHCDIEDRIRVVPERAKVRGLYYGSVLNVLEQDGKLDAYHDYFPDERWSAIRFYPLTDFMLRLAVAGAVIATPETLHMGMHQAMRLNAVAFASNLIGRMLLRVLDRDPVRLTEQAMAARRQSTTYGEWTIGSRGPRYIEAIYRSEYVWLESAIAGAAVGTFDACQIKAAVETQLTDRFNGSTLVSW